MLQSFILLWLVLFNTVLAANLQISFNDLPSSNGKLLFLIFASEEGFPDNEKTSVKSISIPASEKSYALDLPAGEYAISVIHDENDNGSLDTFLGIPREAFGFSNNPRIFFGPPSFDRARFKLDENSKLAIEMKKI